MNIFPVIHHLTRVHTRDEISLARRAGADGVFLISHDGQEDDLLFAAAQARLEHPDWPIGINLLTRSPLQACEAAVRLGLNMVWADRMGVSSAGLDLDGVALRGFAKAHPEIELFASVAFKYQPHEPVPEMAAREANRAGFVATTSGDATGVAPSLLKTARMSAAACGRLAVASGITAANLRDYKGHVSDVLVSTGISRDFHHMDPQKLADLIALARTAHRAMP